MFSLVYLGCFDKPPDIAGFHIQPPVALIPDSVHQVKTLCCPDNFCVILFFFQDIHIPSGKKLYFTDLPEVVIGNRGGFYNDPGTCPRLHFRCGCFLLRVRLVFYSSLSGVCLIWLAVFLVFLRSRRTRLLAVLACLAL